MTLKMIKLLIIIVFLQALSHPSICLGPLHLVQHIFSQFSHPNDWPINKDRRWLGLNWQTSLIFCVQKKKFSIKRKNYKDLFGLTNSLLFSLRFVLFIQKQWKEKWAGSRRGWTGQVTMVLRAEFTASWQSRPSVDVEDDLTGWQVLHGCQGVGVFAGSWAILEYPWFKCRVSVGRVTCRILLFWARHHVNNDN